MEFKKFGISIGILCLLIFTLLSAGGYIIALNGKVDAQRFYKQGLEFYNAQDYHNAYYNFSKIVPVSSYYHNALYKSAKSAEALGDYKTALKKYKLLNSKIKNKHISPFIMWKCANIEKELNKNNEAARTLKKLIKNYPETEYGIGSYFILATVDQKERNYYLSQYLKNSPEGRFSDDAVKMLEKEKLTQNEYLELGKAYLKRRKYESAVNCLKNVPVQYSWVYLTEALFGLNSYKNIEKVVNKGLLADNSHFDESTLEKAFGFYAAKHPKGGLIAWDYIYNHTKDEKIKGISLYHSALLSGEKEKRLKFKILSEKFPNSKYTSDVLYEIILNDYKENRTVHALKTAQKYLAVSNDRTTLPHVLFIIGSIKKQNKDSDYQNYFKRLYDEFEGSYFAYRAKAISNKNFRLPSKLIPKPPQIKYPYREDKKEAEFFDNFANLGDISAFDDFRISDKLIKSYFEYKKGNRALSIVFARDYIKESAPLKRAHIAYKLAYPIYYSDLINTYAGNNNIEPFLMLALIKEESHFNPNTVSGANAVGLTQILPSTAKMITGNDYSISQLKDPELNIKLGTQFFETLQEDFRGNEAYSVLSYNSGPNAVKRWLKEDSRGNFDLFTENIPYSETKYYVKKVMGTYWNYILTYTGYKI